MQVKTYDRPYGEGRSDGGYSRNCHKNVDYNRVRKPGYDNRGRNGSFHNQEKHDNGDRVLLENVKRAMSCPTAKPGDICLIDFGDDVTHCRTVGVRPAICISSMGYNEDSPILRVVPMTRQLKAIDAPYHTFIDKDRCDGLENSGMAMGEQTIPITRDQIIKKISVITDDTLMAAVMKAANAINMEY